MGTTHPSKVCIPSSYILVNVPVTMKRKALTYRQSKFCCVNHAMVLVYNEKLHMFLSWQFCLNSSNYKISLLSSMSKEIKLIYHIIITLLILGFEGFNWYICIFIFHIIYN